MLCNARAIGNILVSVFVCLFVFVLFLYLFFVLFLFRFVLFFVCLFVWPDTGKMVDMGPIIIVKRSGKGKNPKQNIKDLFLHARDNKCNLHLGNFILQMSR